MANEVRVRCAACLGTGIRLKGHSPTICPKCAGNGYQAQAAVRGRKPAKAAGKGGAG
jgi:DnaJ-class molecular chaperone